MNLKNDKYTGNHIDLLDLKTEKLLRGGNVNVVLQDDIWDRDTLLLRSGRYLTENLINKLINFGIRRVSVDFVEQDSPENVHENQLEEFTAGQCALIIENNMINASWLVRHLVDIGFSHKNIFITADYNAINQYFRVKKINFIFAGIDIYEKCTKCIDKYSRLRNIHAFVTIENVDSMRKIRTENNTSVNFFKKSLSAEVFKSGVKRAINANYLDLYAEEALAS